MKSVARTISRKEMLQDGDDLEFRQLVYSILALSSRILEVRNGFGHLINLTGPQYMILISIAHLQVTHGVGANTIAEHLHLSSASITIEVKKLVALSLVDKNPNPIDRRRVRLQITKEGRRKLEGLKSVQAVVNDALFNNLTSTEFRTLRAIMDRLVTQSEEALALLEFHMTKTGTY